jgi:hypothetical protein
MGRSPVASESFTGYLNVFLIVSMMVCVVVILFEAIRKWLGPASGSPVPAEKPLEA